MDRQQVEADQPESVRDQQIPEVVVLADDGDDTAQSLTETADEKTEDEGPRRGVIDDFGEEHPGEGQSECEEGGTSRIADRIGESDRTGR
ncbi:hypothetical protein ACFOJ6_17625 [Gordonia humi]|uniref:hypothetical protein n=1 Tax=Gordonia humi TaxID=686429 RepID=UPI003619E415